MTHATKPFAIDDGRAVHDRIDIDIDTLARSATIDAVLAQYAYEHLLPEYRALPAAAVLPITVDVSYAAILAHRAAEQLIPIRSAFARDLVTWDSGQLDRLRTLALGAWFAARQMRPMDADAAEFERLVAEGNSLREHFVIAATALVARRRFDGETVANMKEASGSRDLASDLAAFVSIFEKNEARSTGRTAIEASELRRAREIAVALPVVRARRDRSATSFTILSETRLRAWTLLARAYDDVRRAVTYVRWAEGDADHIAPSLFAIPGSERRGVSDHPKPATAVVATPNRSRDSGVQTIALTSPPSVGDGTGNPRG